MFAEVWGAMLVELAVTETGTRRFIERWAPFSVSANVAVPFRPFDSMELRATLGMDRERGSHILPSVAVRVAICDLVWEEWINAV
ncbi:MAG: hypothetical protein HDR08_16410 [Lachnospiraceae bacterium]|nr:hypothetical protein [Lachnospiraceae bacterium]MBD5512807.1 hypothetical protein [Lachnospiraceae bacterium]